jgi:very-short-patch-repair endonuclease
MITRQQALQAGLTDGRLRGLVRSGTWSRPGRTSYLVPGADAVRGKARAAIHRRPDAVVCGVTAARLAGLNALPLPGSAEPVHLLVSHRNARVAVPGVVFHVGEIEARHVHNLAGIPVTSPARTLADLTLTLDRPRAISALDAGLRAGWVPDMGPVLAQLFGRSGAGARRPWLREVDSRSESPLETHVRLIVTDAGLHPEELQYRIFDEGGGFVARVDMAWPSRGVCVEADGVEYHSDPAPAYRDRDRQNALARLHWRVQRVTWWDVERRPGWIVAQVAGLLAAAPDVL